MTKFAIHTYLKELLMKFFLLTVALLSGCTTPPISTERLSNGSWVEKKSYYIPTKTGGSAPLICAAAREAKKRGCTTFTDKSVIGKPSSHSLMFRCGGKEHVTEDVLYGCK